MSTTATKQTQPEWVAPTNANQELGLKVYNSLTRSKTPFIPQSGKNVKWYNCGPTVYDASHMGHARNYMTQDYLRRILVDYFGFDVHFVMNITDIDDKIIQRSRRNHLLNQFISRSTTLTSSLLSQLRQSWKSYFRSQLQKGLPDDRKPTQGEEEQSWPGLLALADEDTTWRETCVARDEKFGMHLSALRTSYDAIQAASSLLSSLKDQHLSPETSQEEAHKLINASRDILSPSLDAEFGHSVTDPAIPREHASYWEAAFMKDMKRLRVLPPDNLTRVTDYVPEIVTFVEKLISRGFAYELHGSVYFDTRAFDGAPAQGQDTHWKHTYLKLEPWSKGNQELLQEGEGALSQTSTRYDADFALWKASKPGEPSWPSPWGPGRPGWHIECSVMSSEILGETMDIHSGGSDLAFPHHDNEIAQSEAYHGCRQWVNYFLHTGHLHIEGLKMSKSLKNFITIDEILQKYTARQLRLAFLLVQWNAKVDFQEAYMKGEVRTMETTFDNFFTNVKALVTQAASNKNYPQVYNVAERGLADDLVKSQQSFRLALCDSFNTPQALDVLLKLVSRANIYISQSGAKPNVDILENVARWIGKMLRMFGLGEGPIVEGMVGWGECVSDGDGVAAEGRNREEIIMPYLQVVSAFRDNVRNLAMSKADHKQFLELCDKLRDIDLVPLGVALDDQEDGRALVKLVPAATLIRIRDEKLAAVEAKAAKKAAALSAEREKKLVRLAKGKVAPQEMFKPPNVLEGEYGSWDDNGIPVTDGHGAELTKNKKKKLVKDWENQRKLHEEWHVWQKENGEAI